LENDFVFLEREQIDKIHQEQLSAWGGIAGIRNENGLESAIAQPVNVYLYGSRDVYEIAAAYAYHLAESQAYLDGNKRTGMAAALIFLDLNGIDTGKLPELETYEAMIKVASHEMNRSGLATFFRDRLSR
jgi:death-on-curing protein